MLLSSKGANPRNLMPHGLAELEGLRPAFVTSPVHRRMAQEPMLQALTATVVGWLFPLRGGDKSRENEVLMSFNKPESEQLPRPPESECSNQDRGVLATPTGECASLSERIRRIRSKRR